MSDRDRMRLSASMAAALALGWAWSAAAQDVPAKSVIVNPTWARQPTADELVNAWPSLATEKRVTQGRAVIACIVDIKGQLQNCSVRQEDPADSGFGQAALDLSVSMLMTPKTVDGKPVGGARIAVPINFVDPRPAKDGAAGPASR